VVSGNDNRVAAVVKPADHADVTTVLATLHSMQWRRPVAPIRAGRKMQTNSLHRNRFLRGECVCILRPARMGATGRRHCSNEAWQERWSTSA